MIFDQEKPVPTPRDVSCEASKTRDVDRHGCSKAIAWDVRDGHAAIFMETRRDGSYRRLNLMLPRNNSAQMGERGYEADGSMPAHPEVADIVEEDDACGGRRIEGFAKECANDDLRSARFTNDS